MAKKRAKHVKRQDRFRFRRLDTIGSADAEQDTDFLQDCFVDTGHLGVLSDCRDPRSIVVGRTGSGKTALLRRLLETEERVIEIQPESLALSYISNSTILNFFDRLGVRLDIFFKLLWRHIFTVELIKHHFKIWDRSAKNAFLVKIKQLFLDTMEKKSLKYLETWGSRFWEETEYRIKDVTTKLEKDLKGSIIAQFPQIKFSFSDADKLASEERAEIIHRAQRVVNAVQIRELSEIINLTDKVLSDPQRHYFIIIDRLDEDWIEDRLRYRLIRSLIETLKDFRRIRNAKIAIALRLDLIETVFKLTRDTGFQEEKYESLYLPVKWTEKDLTKMLNRRIDHLVRRRYTNQRVTHKDLLPARVNRKPSMEYILARSMMRPRDVIMFFNCCIEKAVERPTITPSALQESESVYSKNRLRSLADEWVTDYPNLSYFTQLLKSRRSKFSASDITGEDIDDVCLDFCIQFSALEKVDMLSKSAQDLIEGMSDAHYTRKVFLQVFYRVGLVGLKLETFHKVQWGFLGDPSISKSQISNNIKVSIHPMFWRAFGVRSK